MLILHGNPLQVQTHVGRTILIYLDRVWFDVRLIVIATLIANETNSASSGSARRSYF